MKMLFLFLILPVFAFGQKVFKGKVADSKTKLSIAFVMVGLIKENIGTTTGEDGLFKLKTIKGIKNDTLIFSSLGYATKKVSLEEYNENDFIVELSEQITTLTDVIISNKKNWTSVALNDFSNCGSSFITTNGYQSQLAQHFQVDTENSILKEVKICSMGTSLLGKKTIFRIRIYDIDTETKAPSKDLCSKIIEVRTSNKTIKVNLEEYKIYIPNKEFFVAIEWLKVPVNEQESIMLVNGKAEKHVSYRPSIGWTEAINEKMEAWSLNYKNIWEPMFNVSGKTSVSISAIIKY